MRSALALLRFLGEVLALAVALAVVVVGVLLLDVVREAPEPAARLSAGHAGALR